MLATTTRPNPRHSLPEQVQVFPEPPLEFCYGRAMADPHDGLAMFGPYDTDLPCHPKNISYALIGTRKGMTAFRAWARTIQSPVYTDADLDTRLWPMFPGFEAVFACTWPGEPSRVVQLDDTALDTAARDLDPNKRAAKVVEQYLDGISRVAKRDDPVHVVVCVVPDLVWENCRPRSRVFGGVGYRIRPDTRLQRELGQRDLFDPFDPEIYQFSVDFRRQIKARAMRYGIPIQIIRESTLRLTPAVFGQRQLTPLCDRAWNLTVALYYKIGGKPWRLDTAREGVCYIGLAYRRKDPTSASSIACCAAQMFLDSGDGIVFMGEYGPWYSPERDAFHLAPQAARRLLEGVLETYRELEGQPLREIFLHSRSGFNYREFEGFREACPSGVDLVGVRVRQERFDVRLFREGTRPVLRGTFWPVKTTTGYLWASGYKPRLGTYDGWEVPVPLRIDVQHGAADIDQVGSDIFSLTKLNYNACKLGDGEPVTIGFSDDVGEILVSNPTVWERSPKFKFYI
jgi:hypothetical protein